MADVSTSNRCCALISLGRPSARSPPPHVYEYVQKFDPDDIGVWWETTGVAQHGKRLVFASILDEPTGREGHEEDTETEDETGDEEVLPRVGDTLPDTGREGQEGGDGDGTTTAEPTVEGRGEPAGDDTAREVRRTVDETEEPLVATGKLVARVRVDAELRRKEEVGSVDHRLVHLPISVNIRSHISLQDA